MPTNKTILRGRAKKKKNNKAEQSTLSSPFHHSSLPSQLRLPRLALPCPALLMDRKRLAWFS
jgi:hypothetical protein